MPSQLEAKKDVASCEKLRGGAASEQRSADIRMGGKPAESILKRKRNWGGRETS